MWDGWQVVMVLKKEVMKTQSKELEKGAEYRQLLVQVLLCRLPDEASHAEPSCL